MFKEIASRLDNLSLDSDRKIYDREFVTDLKENDRFKGRRLPFDPVQCSWQEVMTELEKATNAAILNQQGDKKFFTKKRRTLSALSRSVMPLLNAIPDDLCFLHGGLAMIFHLAAQRELVRRGILDAFEDIPTIIALACNKHRRFPNDSRLGESLDDLKSTLFAVIPALVTSLFRGFDLPDTLALVKRKSLAVNTLAEDLQDELVFETCITTREIREVTSRTNSGVEEIQVEIMKLQALVSEIKTVQEPKDSRRQPRQSDETFRTETECTKAGSLQNIHPEDLIAMLDVPPEQCARDLNFVIRQSSQFCSTSKSYGAAITSNPRFQAWVNADDADLIFVEGQFDSRCGRTSPVSSFCASLPQEIEDTKVGVVLSFFCGQHVASNDRLRGPRGLIRSLLWQLLNVWPQSSVRANISGPFDDEASISMEDLCFLFQMLLKQVPYLAVFCIIDDMPQFERQCWDKDYFIFLRLLGNLLGEEPGIRFKVLITSSGKSRRLQEQLPDDRCIRVLERDMVSR
ncbi:hypothetical protein VTL71DRAFT_13026 [Oculimacula yallundae]|uniref:Nephrocystin 3-like N-terminal domain-containing protein n=1 Tax=Oculimacula yallundae TaxID=86028 RepID=A0ABR4CRF8_9HELO